MRNIKMIIEYDGTNYAGWQVQKGQKTEDPTTLKLPPTPWLRRTSRREGRRQKIKKTTIQETLEWALGRILQEKIKVNASGRTDAGVHALGQVANFYTKSKLKCQNIRRGLNSILPDDIRIDQLENVDPDFHARFSAQSKLYRYAIVNDSFIPPHLRHFCHLVKQPLDVKKMQKAGLYLVGRHNFRSFQSANRIAAGSVCPTSKQDDTCVRTIKRLDIKKKKNIIYLNIEANGFLYRMVRNIVGTLIEVSRGRLKPDNIKKILRAKDRTYAGPCAPAKGLFLICVKCRT